MYYDGHQMSVGKEIIIIDGKQKLLPIQEFEVITIADKSKVCTLSVKRWPKLYAEVKKVYNDNRGNIIDAVILMSHILNNNFRKGTEILIKKNAYLPVKELLNEGFEDTEKFLVKTRETFSREKIQNQKQDYNELYGSPYLVPWNLIPRESGLLVKILDYTSNGDTILDMGTGFGKNLGYLLNADRDVHGFDISSKAIEIAEKITNLKGKLVICSVVSTPYENNFFSAVLDIGCLHCLNHDELKKAVGEINRILKPGGYLISRFFLTRTKDWLKRLPVKVDGVGLTEKSISEAAGKHFVIEEMNVSNGMGYFIAVKAGSDKK